MMKDITYRCSYCDYFGHIRTKNSWNNKCESCGKRVKNCKVIYEKRKNFKRTNFVDVLMDENPRWSDALGINPSQADDFKKQFPKLNLKFDKEGRCLVRNRAHKKQIMKARGFDEY